MINNDIITENSEEILQFFNTLDVLLNKIEVLASTNRPLLNGERFLTDSEVADLLKISRRTLLEFRASGKISYYHLGGKILYKESDIQKMLEDNCHKSFV